MKCWAGRFTLGIKISRRNIFNLIHADNTTLMTESEEELKNLLIRVKDKTGRADFKLNIEKKKKKGRWRRNRTGRTLSPPQIHQKNI